jgi:hypothetical protein
MAKIQSPSGETEFFQTTELQQAFEKELKTGEKVTVAPGVIEAGFLREAPVRAEYLQAFQDWKDKLYNPVEPFQPPVFRAVCTAVVRPITLLIGEAYTDTSSYLNMPELTFLTAINTSQGYFPVPQCNDTFFSFFNGSEWEWSANPLPFSKNQNRSAPSQYEIIVPDYYTFTAYVKIDPAIPNTGVVNFDGVSITTGLGGGVSYASGAFTCSNLPSGNYEIFNLKADLYVPAYGGPFLYGTSNCSYTLFNYTFTNLYP